jgi:hypothetical protein
MRGPPDIGGKFYAFCFDSVQQNFEDPSLFRPGKNVPTAEIPFKQAKQKRFLQLSLIGRHRDRIRISDGPDRRRARSKRHRP